MACASAQAILFLDALCSASIEARALPNINAKPRSQSTEAACISQAALLRLDRSIGYGWRCALLLNRWRRGGWGRRCRIGDAANALAKTFQSLAQSLTQLRQPLGAKKQKCNHRQ